MQAIIDKKEIRAPFAGVAGIRYVNPGQMVAVGDKLVSLQTLDQVFVDFSLPQNDLAKIAIGLEVKVTTDAVPGREFKGTLNAINPSVDPVDPQRAGASHAREPGPRFARGNVCAKSRCSCRKKTPFFTFPRPRSPTRLSAIRFT